MSATADPTGYLQSLDFAAMFAAEARKGEVVIFTDTFASWAGDITDRVFALPTSTGLFWHSTAAFSVLLNLLVNGVIERLGRPVQKRISRIVEAQRLFDQYAEDR